MHHLLKATEIRLYIAHRPRQDFEAFEPNSPATSVALYIPNSLDCDTYLTSSSDDVIEAAIRNRKCSRNLRNGQGINGEKD